jgi:hypothetical protein
MILVWVLCWRCYCAAGLSQFHSNKSFEYLLDVLDSNEPVIDEHDTAAEAFIGKQSRFCSLLATL